MSHNVNNSIFFCNPCHYFDIFQYICNPFNQNMVSIFLCALKSTTKASHLTNIELIICISHPKMDRYYPGITPFNSSQIR